MPETNQPISPKTAPAKAAQPPRHYGRWALVLLSLFLLLVYGAWRWCEATGFVNLRHIRVTGNQLLTQKEIIKTAGVPAHVSLLRIKPAVIRQRLEDQPYVRAANVSRCFPNQLHISIDERKPFCYIAINKILLLDSSGVILPLPAGNFKANFPIITGFERDSLQIKPGRRTTLPQLQQALALLRIALRVTPEFFGHISEVHHAGRGEFILFTTDGGTPIYLRAGNFAKQMLVIKRFQQILQQKRTLADYQYIDLRWDKQIIVKERQF